MIRCSDLALALLLAQPAMAEPFLADAFGLYDPADAGDRALWSGLSGPRHTAPGAPARIAIFAGPKSLVAGKDAGHVVAIILDRAGNLVADGTPATITVAGSRFSVRTEAGIAHKLLPPGTRAGDLYAGVTAGDQQSPKAMLSVVADVGSIEPAFGTPLPTPQGETVFELTSAPLSDRFGNSVPKGVGATLLLTHSDGSHSIAFGQALGDTLQAQFIARDISGPAEASLALGSHVSATVPLTITAPRPVGRPAIRLEPLPDIAALRVTLGPFQTTEGYALTDGAPVSLTLRLQDGTSLGDMAFVQDGSVALLLPLADPTLVTGVQVKSPLGPVDLGDDWQAATGKVAP